MQKTLVAIIDEHELILTLTLIFIFRNEARI